MFLISDHHLSLVDETRPGRVRPEFYSLLRSGLVRTEAVNKMVSLHYLFVSTAKFELGSKCSSTSVDDRSNLPSRVDPRGARVRTQGVYTYAL